jgi:Gpi18-like mannosyltransferase
MRAAYTESLFLALAIMSFYYARKGKWLPACIAGGFLTATRITGMFIIPALMLEYLQQCNWKLSRIRLNALFLLIVPVGILSYFIINFVVNGSPLSFLALQKEVWNKTIASPWQGFMGAIGWFGDWVKPEQIIIVAWAE